MDNEAKVLAAMKTAGALKTKEIAELSGVDAKEVGKILKKLKTSGEIISPKNCYYEYKK